VASWRKIRLGWGGHGGGGLRGFGNRLGRGLIRKEGNFVFGAQNWRPGRMDGLAYAKFFSTV